MAGTLALIIASAGAMIYSLLHYDIWSFGMPGSGVMPLVGGGIVLPACLWVAFAERPHRKIEVSRTSLAYGAAFIALLPLAFAIGLLPALALVAIAILHLVEKLSLPRSVTVSAAAGFGSWLLFQKILLVSLPVGVVWSRLWTS